MEGKFDCSACERNPELKRILGCTKELGPEEEFQIGPYRLRRCPRAILQEGDLPIQDLFLHWRMWLSGTFPNDGTYMDQPARFVQAMILLDTLWVKYRERLEEKEREELRASTTAGFIQPPKGGR